MTILRGNDTVVVEDLLSQSFSALWTMGNGVSKPHLQSASHRRRYVHGDLFDMFSNVDAMLEKGSYFSTTANVAQGQVNPHPAAC